MIGNVLMISKGKPFDMSVLRQNKASFIGLFAVLILLWLSWGFWSELASFIAQLWAWRPATVIGLAMIIIPILAALLVAVLFSPKRASEISPVWR